MNKYQAMELLRRGGFNVFDDVYPMVLHPFDRQPNNQEQEALQILSRDWGFDYLEPVKLD